MWAHPAANPKNGDLVQYSGNNRRQLLDTTSSIENAERMGCLELTLKATHDFLFKYRAMIISRVQSYCKPSKSSITYEPSIDVHIRK